MPYYRHEAFRLFLTIVGATTVVAMVTGLFVPPLTAACSALLLGAGAAFLAVVVAMEAREALRGLRRRHAAAPRRLS